jgi:hypothetical protein
VLGGLRLQDARLSFFERRTATERATRYPLFATRSALERMAVCVQRVAGRSFSCGSCHTRNNCAGAIDRGAHRRNRKESSRNSCRRRIHSSTGHIRQIRNRCRDRRIRTWNQRTPGSRQPIPPRPVQTAQMGALRRRRIDRAFRRQSLESTLPSDLRGNRWPRITRIWDFDRRWTRRRRTVGNRSPQNDKGAAVSSLPLCAVLRLPPLLSPAGRIFRRVL